MPETTPLRTQSSLAAHARKLTISTKRVKQTMLILRLAVLLICLPTVATAQSTPAAHPTSTPYTGDLKIFEDPDRGQKLQIDRVMDILKIHPGSTVADIGAGGGWFSVRAARRVGPRGHVYAEDINPPYLRAIRERADREHLVNIEPILGTAEDTKLPVNSLDAVLMLKVYHEIAFPARVLASLHNAMKPGARFGIIDRNGTGADHGLDERILREEVERAGFRQVGRYDFTKADGQDYFLIFTKK